MSDSIDKSWSAFMRAYDRNNAAYAATHKGASGMSEARVWDRDKALDKLRKIAARTVDPSLTKPEIDNWTRELHRLTAKYDIDMAEAYDRGELHEQVIHFFLNVPKPWIQKMVVANLIAIHCDCTAIRVGGFRNRLDVFGLESDIRLLKLIIETTYAQGEMKFATATIPSGSVPRTFRRSWWQGFASGLATQTKRAKQEVTKESGTPTTALVLRDKKESVEEEVGKAYPQLRKARRSRTRFTAGEFDGYRAGKEVDLNVSNRVTPSDAKQIDR